MIWRRGIEPIFEENFSQLGELGAAVSIWQHGEPVLGIARRLSRCAAQDPVDKRHAGALLVGDQRAGERMSAPCSRRNTGLVWSGGSRNSGQSLPKAEKQRSRLAQLLSHQAGLVVLDDQSMCATTTPSLRLWKSRHRCGRPGQRTAITRALSGFCLMNWSGESTRAPLRNIGARFLPNRSGSTSGSACPRQQNHRVATIYPAKFVEFRQSGPLFSRARQPGTIQRKAFTSPHGLHAVSAMNTPENRARAFVSFGGIGSAASLAKFYAMLANGGSLEGKRFFVSTTVKQMTSTLASGLDRVFGIMTAFSAGFMKDPSKQQANVRAVHRLPLATRAQAEATHLLIRKIISPSPM